MSDISNFFAWAAKERGTTFKHLAGQHDQSTHGGNGMRKQITVTGDTELVQRSNNIIDKLPDQLVPPYKVIDVNKTSGISRTNNNRIQIGDMPGMDSDAVLEHEILHTVAPKYSSDYSKVISNAGEGEVGKSILKYDHPSQNVNEDFVSSSHAYLSETRGFNGPTFEDNKRYGMLNDAQIKQRRDYFRALLGD